MHNVNADAAKRFCPHECQQDHMCFPTSVEVCARARVRVGARVCVRACVCVFYTCVCKL